MVEEQAARINILEEEVRELRKLITEATTNAAKKPDTAQNAPAPVQMGPEGKPEAPAAIKPSTSGCSASQRYAPYNVPRFCHFCGCQGYSDSCRPVLNPSQRAEIIRSKKLCPKCLKRHSALCRKVTPCAYCGDPSHHRALCASSTAFEQRSKKLHHC
ncbi:hypothetical protein Y032_0431g1318 [Ancylostoma ceylanicum]|nr:hypothetical protein Y032_0431g1318 [Ancylostoma ceylanicum]